MINRYTNKVDLVLIDSRSEISVEYTVDNKITTTEHKSSSSKVDFDTYNELEQNDSFSAISLMLKQLTQTVMIQLQTIKINK